MKKGKGKPIYESEFVSVYVYPQKDKRSVQIFIQEKNKPSPIIKPKRKKDFWANAKI